MDKYEKTRENFEYWANELFIKPDLAGIDTQELARRLRFLLEFYVSIDPLPAINF